MTFRPYGLCSLICFVRRNVLENCLPHIPHLFPLVWLWRCWINLSLDSERFPQIPQIGFLSPECVWTCVLSMYMLRKVFPQALQQWRSVGLWLSGNSVDFFTFECFFLFELGAFKCEGLQLFFQSSICSSELCWSLLIVDWIGAWT